MKKYWLTVLIVLQLYTTTLPYGEKSDSLYNWQERAVHTLTNTCRLSPEKYRDTYLFTMKILLPQTYPAVPPLYWNRALNASSQFHAVEMAGTCGMNHTCNGKTFDVRIKEFFTESGNLGENIAAGYTSPQATVTAWLLDRQQSGDTALDGSGSDGHRANIMSARYNTVGCGYFASGTGRSAKMFWCQDFAGIKGQPALHPIPSASHLFLTSGKITFVANVFDTSEEDQFVELILDGEATPMTLAMGAGGRGTYMLTFPVAAHCRQYYFKMKNSVVQYRYPDSGYLVTAGEGDCGEDFSEKSAVEIDKRQKLPYHLLKTVPTVNESEGVRLFDLQGRVLCGATAETLNAGNSGIFILQRSSMTTMETIKILMTR